MHDFRIKELGRASPYGIYDLTQNSRWGSVGVDHDTASFAVETIRRWWYAVGQPKYPRAGRMLITADSGGSVRSHAQVIVELAKIEKLVVRHLERRPDQEHERSKLHGLDNRFHKTTPKNEVHPAALI